MSAATSELIGHIYDCAIDPSLWPETLERVRAALGFTLATLSVQSMPTGKVLLNENSGIARPWAERVVDYGADIIALWGGLDTINAAPIETPLVLSQVNPSVADGSCRNRFHLEWHRPQGLSDSLTVGLIRDDTTLAAASLVRHDSQGPITAREIDAAALLAPHLRRAVTIGHLLEFHRIAASNFGDIVAGLRSPVMLVGEGLRLVHANAAGEALLTRGEPFSVKAGALQPSSSLVRAALDAAVLQAGRDESAMARRGLGIPAHGKDGEIHALHVLPLQPGRRWPGRMTSAAEAAIFVASTAMPVPEVGPMLAAMFDLTEAESRVFDLIAGGRTVAEAAEALGIGVSTVRTHLLRIFDKTGTHRQADLVRMANALTAPLQ
jgi:DNA-binding CsgD family transcriptional regulator